MFLEAFSLTLAAILRLRLVLSYFFSSFRSSFALKTSLGAMIQAKQQNGMRKIQKNDLNTDATRCDDELAEKKMKMKEKNLNTIKS